MTLIDRNILRFSEDRLPFPFNPELMAEQRNLFTN